MSVWRPPTPRSRALIGGGFASSRQRLEQAAVAESYDVPRPPIVRPRRDKRKRPLRSRPRGLSVPAKKLTRALLKSQAALLGSALHIYELTPRPTTRGECQGGQRPCPWVACKHHLYLDVNPVSGSIKINFPDREPWELAETCTLDVAEGGGVTLEKAGEIMNLTRERIRQMEINGLRAIQRLGGDLS